MSDHNDVRDLLDKVEMGNAGLRKRVEQQANELRLVNEALARRNSELKAYKKQVSRFAKRNAELMAENANLMTRIDELWDLVNYRTTYGHVAPPEHAEELGVKLVI